MEHKVAETNGEHVHSMKCGHTKLLHNGHVDFVESNGHLHHRDGDHFDECEIAVDSNNPDQESVVIDSEIHNDNCGHQKVIHGDHVDYIVNARLQHVHGDHVDDHGTVDPIA
ncbi:hypothetical protein [Lactobacillus sp. Sy-1]|uniref:hypothetical protein n=1 Tax=Lactobacillus sp. Sy-1 TaxID=2109645 RepID=UPI001C57DFD4|nr:hypothetical protein [Lactobacillus sp. Sy-1]MBW1605016.1 hypothetical protein [Lactobacillus sp. Sy-1]